MPHVATSRLSIETATDATRLDSLAAEWSALWDRDPRATPFQTPEWLQTWWRHFGSGQLHTLAVRRNERLVGIIPLFVQRDGQTGAQCAQLLGTGVSDYLDAVVERGVEEECMESFFAHLADQRDWDCCEFRNLRASSPLLRASSRGWLEECEAHEVCPVLELPKLADGLGNIASEALLKNASYCQRKAELLPNTRFETVHAENFSELFRALIQLHRARWNMRGEPGVLDTTWQFHMDVAAQLFTRGLLRLCAWRVNGRIIGALHGFLSRRRFYYYISGFDPAFAQFSPGNVLVAHAITEAIREGATEFDFLRGAEAYKYRWGAIDQPLFRRQLRRD